MFQLAYYMGFTYREVYTMPIYRRNWFLHRLIKEIEDSRKAGNTQSRAPHHNQSDARQLQGKQRGQVPAKLRRFT